MRRATGGTFAWALGAAAVAALLSIAVNVATDLKDSVLAWLAVTALTLGAGTIAAAVELRKSDEHAATRTPAPARPRNRPSMGTYGETRDVFQAGSIGSIHTGSSGVLVIAVSLVVVLAASSTLVAQAVAHRIRQDRGTGALPSQPGQPTVDAGRTGGRGEPFTVSAHTRNGSCSTWVTTQSPATINAALPIPHDIISTGNWEDWAPVSDGAAASYELVPGEYERDPVSFTVQGNSSQAVTIIDLTVRVTARRAPIRGISLSRGCGDPGAYRWFNADLDSSPVKISTADYPGALPDDAPPEQRVPLALPYTVSLSDPETFVVEALTTRCDCAWVIDLHWTSAGKSGVRTISDARGRPFRTSSTANAKTCWLAEVVECGTT